MIKIYGSLLCPDCVRCCDDLKAAGVEYAYLDFSRDLMALKEFLCMRDSLSIFDEVRREGRIGIPCLVTEAGEATLSWEDLM